MPDALVSTRIDHTTMLIERYFGVSDGELLIGGLPVSEIAARHGTPAYIYNRHALDIKWELLRATLPVEFDIYYSIKANPNRTFLEYFLNKGCGLEIASGGELHLALNAGCPPAQIIYAGPGKTTEELEFALSQDIGEIHVESLREAKRISEISRRHGRRTRIALRVNPRQQASGGAMRMGGKSAPFGIDEEKLDHVLDEVLADASLKLVGVHLFIGTQILDHTVLLGQYREALRIALRVADRSGRPLETLDLGGGLGTPYFAHERELDMDALAAGLGNLMADAADDPRLCGTKWIVEPGRFLTAEAGLYLTRVIDIKESRGRNFLIVDGGMHHHLAASGNLGQTIKRNYPVALVNRLEPDGQQTVNVVGPLCTPLDVLARDTSLPAAEIGDLVGVFQSGAYARTSSPLGFLSHQAPPEVWVDAGTDYQIRRRGRYEDYLKDQCQANTDSLCS